MYYSFRKYRDSACPSNMLIEACIDTVVSTGDMCLVADEVDVSYYVPTGNT